MSTPGWIEQITAAPGTTVLPDVTFISGPGSPPSGIGSAQFSVGSDGNNAAQLRNPNFHGTKLSDLTALSYSTYVTQDGSGGQAVYIILQVDTDGDAGIEDLLFFEPIYQSSTFFPANPQGPLTTGTWQSWDAFNGGWYSVFGTAGSGPGTNVVPFSTLATALGTNAVIANSSPSGLGGVRLVTGFGAGAWDNFIGSADAFSIGVSGTTTTYDFEPAAINVVKLTNGTDNNSAPGVYVPVGSTVTFTYLVQIQAICRYLGSQSRMTMEPPATPATTSWRRLRVGIAMQTAFLSRARRSPSQPAGLLRPASISTWRPQQVRHPQTTDCQSALPARTITSAAFRRSMSSS